MAVRATRQGMATLYIQRHGRAEAAHGKADRERALTDVGRAEIEAAARAMASTGFRCDVIWSSPLVRAFQTAELMAQPLPGVAHEVVDELSPGGDLDALARALGRYSARSCVLVVGHMPDVAHATHQFLADTRGAPTALETGSVVCVRFAGAIAPGHGSLEWLATVGELARAGIPGGRGVRP